MERTRRTRRRGRGIERVKNVLIVLLTLSAVYLAARTLADDELAASMPQGWVGAVLSVFRSGNTQPQTDTGLTSQTAAAAQPVRMAVHNGAERYAVQYDAAQTDRLFDNLGILLSEALASAAQPQPVDETVWRQALQSPGVWFDFLGHIPLEALYAWMGEGGSNPVLEGFSARQLAVAVDPEDPDGGVALFYHNEADGLYYACKTAVIYSQHMDALVEGYGSSGTAFVFELEEDEGYGGLDPYVLIPSTVTTPLIYRAQNPLAEPDSSQIAALQQALEFQPQENSIYPAVQGGLMIREGRETLLIGENGVVQYHVADGEPSRYTIGEGESYSVAELVETTRKLAADSVGRFCGSAQLYLIGVTETEEGDVEVSYGYALNGAEVLLPDDGCAARFTVRDGHITDYTLCFRNYEETGEHSLILQERQAAAALNALCPEGGELVLCYIDGGGDTVEASWTAR